MRRRTPFSAPPRVASTQCTSDRNAGRYCRLADREYHYRQLRYASARRASRVDRIQSGRRGTHLLRWQDGALSWQSDDRLHPRLDGHGCRRHRQVPTKYSNEFQVWMDFAVLIIGQQGIYIHEGPATIKDNGGPSAGCVHLAAPHAKEFYDWVVGPTRVTLTYPW